MAADAHGVPHPLDEPVATIPLAVGDLEELRCGEILEIESCVQREEPDLVSLAFAPPHTPAPTPTRSLSSAHTQVVGAVCLEIDTDLDEADLDPEQDLVRSESRPHEVELAGSIDVHVEEVDVDVDEFVEPVASREAPAEEGTVVAMIPGPSLPFWPAPARGETVIAAAPPEPPAGYARWSA